MNLGNIIGYSVFFILFFIMIFKPTLIRSFLWSLERFFRGREPMEDHPYQKAILIVFRFMGVVLLITFTNELLIDAGLTKKQILVDAVSKININPDLIANIVVLPFLIISVLLGILSIPIGLFGIIAPFKFRSFAWHLYEKIFGFLPNEDHFFQGIFFYWLYSIVLFVGGLYILGAFFSAFFKH